MNIKQFVFVILVSVISVTDCTPSVQAVVLAAGRSTRVKTEASKLTYPFCGKKRMIEHPTSVLQNLSIPIIMVVGYQKEVVQQILTDGGIKATYIEQTNPKGTGHAVQISKHLWNADHILVINGDGPLIDEALIKSLIEKHTSTNATATFVTAYNTDQTMSVAHVLKDNNGKITIVEHQEFEGDRTQPYTMNAGIYIFKRDFLENNIDKIPPYKNGEYGIPQLIHKAQDQNLRVETADVPLDKVRGVNTQKELAIAERIKRNEIIEFWMNKGVRFIDPSTTILDCDIELSHDTVIGAGVHILDGTKIGSHCEIEAYSIIKNSKLADHIHVGPYSLLLGVQIPAQTNVQAKTFFKLEKYDI